MICCGNDILFCTNLCSSLLFVNTYLELIFWFSLANLTLENWQKIHLPRCSTVSICPGDLRADVFSFSDMHLIICISLCACMRVHMRVCKHGYMCTLRSRSFHHRCLMHVLKGLEDEMPTVQTQTK